MKTRDATFEYEGYCLHYEEYGEGDRVLVYTSGLLLDTELNRDVAEALAKRGNHVVLLDLLGQGLSDKPADLSAYRMDVYARQIVGLLDHLGVETAAIGGISLGANVSLQMAVQAPSRTRALLIEMPVLEAATPLAALTFVPALLMLRATRPVAAFVSRLFRRIPSLPFGPLNSVLHLIGTPPDVTTAVLHGILVGPVGPSVAERAAIEAPMLILAHGNDWLHPFSDAENLAAHVPQGRLERASSIVELRIHPERLTAIIADFLEDVWAGEGGPPHSGNGSTEHRHATQGLG